MFHFSLKMGETLLGSLCWLEWEWAAAFSVVLDNLVYLLPKNVLSFEAAPFLALFLEEVGLCWDVFCLHPLVFPGC